MLRNQPYSAPYCVIFEDPQSGRPLFCQIWNGGGFDRVKTFPRGMKVIAGNNDCGYRDVTMREAAGEIELAPRRQDRQRCGAGPA